ncbi:gamma-glutamylcyclotransferase family protein, partial [Vibrio sp. 10N.222.49.E5]
VHGLVRHWSKIDDSYVLSPLIVNPGDGQVNGVLLEVDDITLADFDRRERGYHRIELKADQIESNTEFKQDQSIWVYIKNEIEAPCENSPI